MKTTGEYRDFKRVRLRRSVMPEEQQQEWFALLDDADRAEELEQLLRDIRLDCCFVSLETLKRIDAALAPKPPHDANQCDGCRAGRPLNSRGQHVMGDGEYSDLMTCQRHKYEPPEGA